MKNILLIIAFLILSCGARKVQKSEAKVTAQVENSIIELKKDSLKIAQTENVVRASSSKETQKTDETSLVFTPIDSTKSIEIMDGKGNVLKVKNAKVHRASSTSIKTKTQNQNIDTTKSTNVVRASSSTSNETTKAKVASSTTNKNTDRKNFMDMFWLVLALAVCIGLFLYYNGKNGKNNDY